jgi:lysophospholipase L1-like esterase
MMHPGMLVRPLSVLAVAAGLLMAADDRSTLIDAMEQPTFTPGSAKVAITVVDGQVGHALQFSFADGCQSTFATSRIHGTPEWDHAAGISFWVKGDGSAHLGGIEFLWNDDYGQRYDAAFPISSTTWTKVVIPWRDLIPVIAAPGCTPLDAQGAHRPSQLSGLAVGKWWYWGDYVAHAYAIDEIRLEADIAVDSLALRAAAGPLSRVAAKLQASQPITVVTLGDSLTDTHHWSNHEHNWPAIFTQLITARYHVPVTLINPAMGGTELKQNLVVMPRWLATTPHPDLVTVEFGGNDWNSGMRGPSFLAAQRDAIQRIRRATQQGADVLIITTLPSVATWDVIGELAEACRGAATAEHAGCCDAFAAFHALGKDHEGLFASDHVHLGASGQQALAEAVVQSIAAGHP